MLTQEDLEKIAALINTATARLDHKIETEVSRLELTIEASHEFNRKAHAEIMDKLVDSNELNGNQLTDHEKRIERVEEHTGLTKS